MSASHTADLMDRVYRRQRHIYDFTRKYYLLGRDRLIAELDPPAGGSVLEVGCGTGRNLIAAAQKFPDACFYGVDISSAMLATARRSIDRAGLAGRITIAQGDAACFDPLELFGTSGFDRIFFSYSLSMIPQWRQALAHALQMARSPHGRVLIVDFGQQEGLPALFRIALFAWLKAFHVTPRVDLMESMAELAAGSDLHCRSAFAGYACCAEIRL